MTPRGCPLQVHQGKQRLLPLDHRGPGAEEQGKDEKDPNREDYHTKRHNAIHHQGVRNTYVFDG